jgi:hypothetical protein
MNAKHILVIVAIGLAAAGIVWDTRIGLAGVIVLSAINFVP